MGRRIEEDIWKQCFNLLLPPKASLWKLFEKYIKQPYSEPHRHYHNLNHIRAILTEFEAYKYAQVKGSLSFSLFSSELASKRWSDLAVILAILFHDSVYDPKSKENEENSVRWLRGVLSEARGLWESEGSRCDSNNTNSLLDNSTQHILWLDPPSAEFVEYEAARFIMGTKNHFDASNRTPPPISKSNCLIHSAENSDTTIGDDIVDSLHLVLDLDLTVFGLPWKGYVNYVESIRKEYQFYPDEAFMHARYDFLQHVLDQPQVYKTRYFYDKYERVALENLTREQEEMRKAMSAGKFYLPLD